ncbi:MAG TPA: pilus assembly protein TadG-related protein, partial [Candidatus Sulfotelmatobacter sp.]|nr:pilus assembly protein TadG-related protein [Candidatus Sulfotelmatobacter sp.]
MKPPALSKSRHGCSARRDERGITMLIVALAMVAIIGMAALSIDVITLYLAREEAQRAADAAALTAARVISMSGITGAATTDTQPTYWQAICGTSGTATQAAQAVLNQNAVAGSVLTNSTINYSAGNGSTMSSNADCSTLPDAFGVNPVVTVQVQQTGLPTFFSRIWRRTTNTVSATASAEVFNPSNSGNMGNQTSGNIIPVQPRCVKPWMVPNLDPLNPNASCQTNCQPFVSATDGHIVNSGISLNGGNSGGVIGERFLLIPDCLHHISAYCSLRTP